MFLQQKILGAAVVFFLFTIVEDDLLSVLRTKAFCAFDLGLDAVRATCAFFFIGGAEGLICSTLGLGSNSLV